MYWVFKQEKCVRRIEEVLQCNGLNRFTSDHKTSTEQKNRRSSIPSQIDWSEMNDLRFFSSELRFWLALSGPGWARCTVICIGNHTVLSSIWN